jgi:hypothetical protein
MKRIRFFTPAPLFLLAATGHGPTWAAPDQDLDEAETWPTKGVEHQRIGNYEATVDAYLKAVELALSLFGFHRIP